MNNNRRKEIKNITNNISKIIDLLNDVLASEEESFENMPEGIQASDNGIASEEAQDALNEAICMLEEAIECLSEI